MDRFKVTFSKSKDNVCSKIYFHSSNPTNIENCLKTLSGWEMVQLKTEQLSLSGVQNKKY